jgi:hypothetical protein
MKWQTIKQKALASGLWEVAATGHRGWLFPDGDKLESVTGAEHGTLAFDVGLSAYPVSSWDKTQDYWKFINKFNEAGLIRLVGNGVQVSSKTQLTPVLDKYLENHAPHYEIYVDVSDEQREYTFEYSDFVDSGFSVVKALRVAKVDTYK